MDSGALLCKNNVGYFVFWELGIVVGRLWSGFALTLILLMAVATAIGLGLKQIGVDDPELALVPAVVVLWLIDGVGGGIAAVIVATVIAWYIFLPPQWSFRIADGAEVWELVIYVAVTCFVCSVIQGQKKRITELLADNLALNRRLLERQGSRVPSADD